MGWTNAGAGARWPVTLSFEEALEESSTYPKRHLLLGNGFSIACRRDIFLYDKLFERADFSDLSPSVRLAFRALGTSDFERVIKVLRDASDVLEAYPDAPTHVRQQLRDDADRLREVLVETIASSHPSHPASITESEYAACREFLQHFTSVYTLNYDLLLYWTVMHTAQGEAPRSDDGFRKPPDDFDAGYVTWDPSQSHDQSMWYLHGALHVFDTGTEVQKYTWNNTGVRLINQIRDALQRDYFPLFVAEGTSAEKYERIRHSDYLAKAYRSFQEITGALFVLGHSLAANDEHFLKVIERGKVRHLFVGLFGDPEHPNNKAIMRRASLMPSRRRRGALTVSFYDSASARVWGK
jgi:hypothetical protein